MSSRDTKSEGGRAPVRRKKKARPDQTQDDATIVAGVEDDQGTARASKPQGKKKIAIKIKKRTNESKDNSKENKDAAVAPSGAGSGAADKPKEKEKTGLQTNIDAAVADFVKCTMEKGVEGLRKEFAEMKTYSLPDMKYEHFTTNIPKNRYRDVVCLDHNRVILTLNVPPDSDYIHANHIKLDGLERNYIATQGPLEVTIADFWRLAYQENAQSIVMLCKVIEDNKAKCFQYFPLEQGTYKNYGCMFVNNKRVETNEDKCTIYTLEILPDGCSNSNIVKLIHMDQWPDRGVPEKPMPILRLIRAIPAGLCVLHCSAGIGRTGTVITIDTAIHRLWKGQHVVMKDLFKELRNQRASAIQTDAQYVFIHTCILEYIRAKVPGKYRDTACQFAEEVKKANMV